MKYLILISENILIALIAVMFTLYHHEFFEDTQKEAEHHRNCPLVELPGGELEYRHIISSLITTNLWP